MPEIHELSAVLADQIAAGEVVERPASVVKELVENAIDAKSTRIDILLKDSGISEIRIIDNGTGIEANQVQTAFRRHATSKITSRQDLFKVATLGFRGEALPSIASISDVVMKTATQNQAGVDIHYRGGKLISEQPSESRTGTDITVKDLFFNTPARLKYLKSMATELSKITDIVNRIALSYPKIAFSVQNNRKLLLQTTGNGNLQQVIANIYGVSNAKKMLAIQGENVDFAVSGFVSLPEFTRANRSYITVLINGRYVKNFQVVKAIIAGYGSKLMVGRFPVAVLNIKMNPLLVDVNVHPTKQEVRISEEDSLLNLVTDTIQKVLFKQNLIPDAVSNLKSQMTGKTPAQQLDLATEALSQDFGKTTNAMTDEYKRNINDAPKPIIISSKKSLNDNKIAEFKAKYTGEPKPTIEKQPATTEDKHPSTDRFPMLTYIGQLHGTYLLAEGPDGLYIVDQHAAQERLNYERFRVEIGQVSDDQQDLLVPIYLDYSTSDTLKIKEKQDVLESCGIFLEEFGKNTFVVSHHPTWFIKGQEEATIKEMIDEILNDKHMTVAKFREKNAIMMSCKKAIKANHHLEKQQAQKLLKDLTKAKNPFNCPHGRPVLVHFSNTDLEKMFKRIQDSHQTGPIEE